MEIQVNSSKGSLSYRLLMQHRIHEILIVSSLYDAFKLEEDGRLSEMLISEYQAYNLINVPRITRVSTADHAFRKMEQKHYDLVITMAHIIDANPFEFGRTIHERFGDIPVVMLTANKREYEWVMANSENTTGIDRIFYWLGDSSIFPALIKYIEDKKNARRDIQKGMVRAIIVVEDSPSFYSVFLPIIYRIIIEYTGKLISREYTDDLKLLRMYSRPKILLATNYEEAVDYYSRYKNNLLAVISDIRYPKAGKINPHSGVEFLKTVMQNTPSVPMLLLSMEKENARYARSVNAYFLDKNSPDLIHELRQFVIDHCGFGDFVFRTPSKKEILRVRTLRSLETALAKVPLQSISYHAKRDHFCNWMAVRGYFELADKLKPLNYDDFTDPEDLRKFLIDAISNVRRHQLQDKVVIFNAETYDPELKYLRIGTGTLGGKGRGLVFLVNYLSRFDLEKAFPNMHISVPRFVVLGTHVYDDFMERNNLSVKALTTDNDQEIDRLFLDGEFDRAFTADIIEYLRHNNEPLAVRSSSLLEDSFFEPFAGIYRTLMLPNCDENLDIRVRQLLNAIKLVYASVFQTASRSYMSSTGHRPEDEKMGVIIQHLIGKSYDDYFYPTFSGVMQSYNYYPQKKLTREGGLATVAMGLGRTVVNGEKALRFSPERPKIIPQFYDTESTLRNSQTHFYALNLHSETPCLLKGEESNLDRLEVSRADESCVLSVLSSVYNANDNSFSESSWEKGPRIITFANILKYKSFPLAQVLQTITKLIKDGMGSQVEMEFAANVCLHGEFKPEFYILQIRPQVTYDRSAHIKLANAAREKMVLFSDITLGNGICRSVKDIVYVDIDTFDILKTEAIVTEIRNLNAAFSEDRPYLLIGPGRWGTADPMLGIPVNWNDISHVRSIVELGLPELYVEPSFGSHFFQNMTSLGISYFTIPPAKIESNIDWGWLQTQKAEYIGKYVRHIHCESPIVIQVNGIKGEGLILKPDCENNGKQGD
jgi:DNA-binding NarL/FixJ family response regulator